MYYVTAQNLSIFEAEFQSENLELAKAQANHLQKKKRKHYEIIHLGTVYTTQTLHEALLEATDVPYMARPGDYASQFAEEAGISYESALSQLNMD
jgi:transposase